MLLTRTDVQRLAETASPKARADVASAIAHGYGNAQLSGREKEIAVDIFRLLMRDAEVKIRMILARSLRSQRDLPRDIALTLAQDVAEVATPMLEFSPVLADEDLLEIIHSSRESDKWAAIARRAQLTSYVSAALMNTLDTPTIQTLCYNQGAELDERSILGMVQRISDQESVVDALMQRGGLSVTCVEKLFLMVNDQLRHVLIKRYNLSRHLVEGSLQYAREWATLGVAAQHNETHNVEALVRQMHQNRRLTSSVVIRSLCVGDMQFFEYALAALTTVPVENVRVLIRDSSGRGFESLYKMTPLPPTYLKAVSIVLTLAFDVMEEGHNSPEEFCKLVMDRIRSHGYDRSIEYMPLLLAIIKGHVSELSTIH